MKTQPKFTYHCKLCMGAISQIGNLTISQLKKEPVSETHTLGTWRCKIHGKCKVFRAKN